MVSTRMRTVEQSTGSVRRRRLPTPLALVALMLVLVCSTPVAALDSQGIFEANESAVFQVQVVNRETGKKSSIGSGFIYANAHELVTNYHVVSGFIENPGDYDLRFVGSDGRNGSLELRAVDAVHDLALVRAGVALGTPLVSGEPPAKGAALYAMGNPLDLGLTIAAGTNGGILYQTDDSRILFSGSLNPGMSGGPTFDEHGTVVGVNVSTARNDISFIVPTRYLEALVNQPRLDPETMLDAISRQIRTYQAGFLEGVLSAPWPTTQLRRLQVPGAISPTVRCWDATPKIDEDRLYKQFAINCQNENDIFLTDRIDVGKLLYEYAWIESDKLESLRFNRLYEALNNSQFTSRAKEDDVTRFTCKTRFVALDGMTMKTTVCRRDYKRYAGLSDVLVTAALVGREKTGFIFNLDLSGTDAAMANRLLARFLEEMAWTN